MSSQPSAGPASPAAAPATTQPAAKPLPAKPAMLRCSTCGQPFLLEQSRTPPFCSPRCQLVDLQHWLDESIGVPCEGESEPEDDQW